MQYVTLTVEYALKRFGNNGLDLPAIKKLIGKKQLIILGTSNQNCIK